MIDRPLAPSGPRLTALVASDDLKLLREQIDDLAFTFIAPLGADYCNDF